MSNFEKPYYLVKIVNKKWADKFMNGEIFMRAIACFGDLLKRGADANNQFRGDTLEGVAHSFENYCDPNLTYTDSDGNTSAVIFEQAALIDVLTYREKIFCLYALEYDEESGNFIEPDSRVLDFGDTAVIIHNPVEFLYRVCSEMLHRFGENFWTSFMRVEYNIDLSKNKPYDEFCKSTSYSWQNEFRIALDLAQGKFDPDTINNLTDFERLTFPGKIIEDTNPDSLADSLILNIGNIRDISISIPTSDFIDSKRILDSIPHNSFPPKLIKPIYIPRSPQPTFFKLAFKLP